MPDDSWIEKDLIRLYQSVPILDFSKDLLESAASTLWVHDVPACGWLDLGTPERLTDHLLEHGQQPWDGPTPGAKEEPPRAPREYLGTLEATAPAEGVGEHAVT
jgi:hypothetical protein